MGGDMNDRNSLTIHDLRAAWAWPEPPEWVRWILDATEVMARPTSHVDGDVLYVMKEPDPFGLSPPERPVPVLVICHPDREVEVAECIASFRDGFLEGSTAEFRAG